jgi:hypothetical protein
MFNFVQKIIYWFLSVQEKVLRKNLKRTLGSSYTNSTSKTVFTKSDSLKLTSGTDKNKAKLDYEVKSVLKKYENDPEKLLKFVEDKGTRVCKIYRADVFLKAIGYEEGLIGSLKGLKALYLSVLLTIMGQQVGISFKTKPMFVLSKNPINSYNTIQQFHKWYAMKLNLPGFDFEAQANFQKFLGNTNDNDIKALSMSEIIGLKEAIARDVEAINFVVELAKSVDGTRNAMGKISAGEGASI